MKPLSLSKNLCWSLILSVILTAPALAARDLVEISSENFSAELAKHKDKMVLANVWAIWCEPCVEEMPEILKLKEEYGKKGLDLMLISTDFKSELSKVKAFLKKIEVDFVTYRKTGSEDAFINKFHKNWSGALPATVLYDRKGKPIAFWEGPLNFKKVRKVLNEKMKTRK